MFTIIVCYTPSFNSETETYISDSWKISNGMLFVNEAEIPVENIMHLCIALTQEWKTLNYGTREINCMEWKGDELINATVGLSSVH